MAAPSVANLSPRGLQIGNVTEVTLAGSELGPSVKLVAPFAIAQQEVLPGGNDKQVKLKLTLANDVAPGIYPVFVATDAGISAPLMLGVDRLPQQPFAAELASLPVALSGTLSGGQILESTFAGRQGQAVVIDLEVRRLGANFTPVVRLTNSKGRQLTYSPPRHWLGGDARLAITLPADDTYTITWHDQLYRAGAPGHYRLKVGALEYADFALPAAVSGKSPASVRFTSSNLPPEATAVVDASQHSIPGARVALPTPGQWLTGAQPSLVVSDAAEAAESLESQPNGQLQTLAPVPCAVTGVISVKGEEDRYLIPVTAGQKLRIAVEAHALGSPLDTVLLVRNVQGNELARNDDRPGSSDSALDFTVPANTDQVAVCLRDMTKQFGPECVYRIHVRDAAAPDVSATIETAAINIPAGGTTVVPVTIARTNYNGPLRIEASGLVGEIELAGNEIPAGANTTLLTFTAKHGESLGGLANLVVRATEPNVELARYVAGPDSSDATKYQPHVRHTLGVAIGPAAPLALAWDHRVEREKALLGKQLPLPLTLMRREGTTGDVRLKLLTTQAMPKKKIKENNQDKEVDDVERALRLAADTPLIKPETSKVVAALEIPGDLPQTPWVVVVVAELLAADGKTVIATASTAAEAVIPESPQ